ncbi:MAG TPA: VOC family protein [Bryobacteraceae bacterium]|nr:VOC family protein [Bryobacteraceae bacterium]
MGTAILAASEKGTTMTVKKITPVLFAQEIESCVAFWTDRLGFEKTAEVPDGGKLAFAMLQKGGVELMYQSYASAEKDLKDAAVAQLARKGPTFLFAEVDNLEAIIAATEGAPVLTPVRTTFYGSTEISVQDPAGHVVTFAQFGAPAKD